MRTGSTHAILTRHFLRRFLENDLIAPDADRSHLLAVIGASLFSTTIFITMVMSCLKYVVGYYTPGQAAIASLDDKFFYISVSMVVVALLAVAQWDALAVDKRDAAILDPLPVRPLAVRRAKLAAVALFGCAAAAIVNLASTVIFPLLVLVKQIVGIVSALQLIATHALIVLGAAAFGFLSVIALRETLAAICGPRWFARVSPWVQGTLIVALGTTLLLLPTASNRVERTRLHDARIIYSPPAWFLGAYEQLSGWILIDAPRRQLNSRLKRADVAPTAAYRADVPIFADLAARVPAALVTVTLLALLAYFDNARRPAGVITALPRRQRPRAAGALARMALLRDSAARAGFAFTLAALWRSSTHRLTLACCGAAALAMSLVALSSIDIPEAASTGRAVPRLLIVQPFLMGMLLIGFRHVIRVPAELRANWGFQLAWRGHDRQFTTGARRAALVALVIPALAIVFGLDALVLGPWIAFAHALLGLAGAITLLEALMVGYDKVPFTCSYLPNENMKALGPLYLAMFLIGASWFAGMESRAITSGDPTRLLVTLAVVFAAFRIFSRTRPRLAAVDFDEVPATTQKLGLNA
jgi:hypothetical protein